MLKIIKSDLFKYDAPALAHGVNCHGVMGAGVAVEFKTRWPEMYTEYRNECLDGNLTPGGVFVFHDGEKFIYNIASQDRPGRDAQYGWLLSGLDKTCKSASWLGLKEIAMPKIGCGIGGLEWKYVSKLMEMASEIHNIDVVVCEL